MERTRQLIPEGLAEMPPGPELAAVLATIDVRRLSGLDCVEVLRARHRQTNHDQAKLMAAMVEVALCGIGPDDELPRMDSPDEFSADEIRGALSWTRSAANTQLSLAWDLVDRLPQVFAALDAGSIDGPKTKVFSEWTHGLTDAQAHQICDRLLPEAPTLTTGQLAERIKKMAIAIEPDWARRRYEEAVRDRKVVGYRNEDGTANLCGYNLPIDRTAAACANIDALARKAKQAGDARPIDHIRSDLYLGMLDGTYTGRSETDIITHLLTAVETASVGTHTDERPFQPAANPRPATRERHQQPADDTPGGAHATRDAPGQVSTGETSHAPDPNGEIVEDRNSRRPAHSTKRTPHTLGNEEIPGADLAPAPSTAHTPIERPRHGPAQLGRRMGVEVRVEVTTLLGLDDHPAEITGWGFVDAATARRLVTDQTAAEWRYAITDNDGHLLFEGITRHRPSGFPSRRESPCRGGIVELQIPLVTLRRLAARPVRLGPWATVLADLARQADHQEAARRPRGEADGEDSVPGYRPGARLRRRTQIRDRTCRHPGCRAPAHGTDGDHTKDWAFGGATSDGNIASLCRHDHRLKHEGGWTVQQREPGHLVWTSRLGRQYRVPPPLIIKPIPTHVPRRSTPRHSVPSEDGDDPIWHEPGTERQRLSLPLPPRGLGDEIPPY